ncbi:DUF1254 domain-containing protein [Cupriavidus taiwanensis]|uniref:DUF1254 domain-containing protein n=1 Tax=Cupriavidus taiwanensis TaxID=164546 RepID=A0A375JAK1_9BURK|nr:DUF1254 domain-containing protein [Cupriavidus taiwanensis]SPS01909.1 conserved hypothetical protein, DUF1254 DUF1214; putative exported protein [Cupriavidus taiwanensis]
MNANWWRHARAAVLAVACLQANAQPAPLAPAGIDARLAPAQIEALTRRAYFWGLQQAGFYELRYVFTQAEQMPAYRGINRLAQQRQLFSARERFATTPNASTLYSGGFFDLSGQPVVVTSPRVEDGRYWSIQALDQYADWFFMAGSQFTGNAPQRYLIVGPNWRGTLPGGFRGTEVVRAPSDAFAITLRVAVSTRDAADFAAAHRLMDGVSVEPLDRWQRNGGQPVPLAEVPKQPASYRSFPRMARIADLASSMTATDYLRLASLVINDETLTQRADSVAERDTLRALAPLGLRKGVEFDPARLTPAQRSAVQKGFAAARAEARAAFSAAQIDMNGWKLQSSLFHDSNDYKVRAGAADIAWGSPVPFQSHTIAYAMADAQGRPLDGAHRYTLTLDMNHLPPVTEFWELPVYDDGGYFVDNPIDRYSVTSYQVAAGQFAVKDGKLTLYIQHQRPTDPEQARNWLPLPAKGPFRLAARFYGPTSPLVDGSYAMPQLVRQE